MTPCKYHANTFKRKRIQNGLQKLGVSMNVQKDLYVKRDIEYRKQFLIDKSIPRCSKILDIGCGNGEYLSILKYKARVVIGIDIDHKLCRIADKKGSQAIIADIRRLPFKDKTFDCVWASEIIEHTPKLDINEIERVVKDKILITMPNPLFPYYNTDPTHILVYSISTLRKYFRNRNRALYRIRGMGYCIPRIFQMPHIFQILFLGITWFFPWVAPTIVIIGKIKNRQI